MEEVTKTTGFLTGKKVVILGASSGIGLATAQASASEGAEVAIVSSDQQRINNALSTLPPDSKGFVVDLAQEQQIEHFFADLGPFDHLIFTAGENLQLGNIADVAVADAQKFFTVRYWGAFAAVKYGAPNINKSGSIILTGGSAGARPGKGWSLGASICAAMEGFTRAMAVELAPVRVNIVVPGLVKTNLWNAMTEQDKTAMFDHFASTLPVNYIATAEDIAQSYMYLMRQPYSTGQRVVVDGGYVLV